MQQREDPQVVILMGVSGSGKTTIGALLAAALGWKFFDADDLHPPANVDKMRRGLPLTDEDREPWLDSLETFVRGLLRDDTATVIACSALKKRYRERLSVDPRVRWVYLKLARGVLEDRLSQRSGHFMSVDLLESQLRDLEEPGPEAAHIDCSGPLERVVPAIRAALGV